ncbi:MAG: hypothetical protein FVQ82_17360 [Planctomycetes bacterium]|nr:hypothetical protein [Planctomycetota bacterium]
MRYWNGVVRLGVVIIFVVGAASFALAEKIHLRGAVTVDGKVPKESYRGSLSLVATDKEHLGATFSDRIYRNMKVKRDGTFSLDLDVPKGKKFFILPYNESGLSLEKTPFYSGYAEFRAEGNPVVQVNLRTTEKGRRYVKLVDEAGKPVPDIAVKVIDDISLGTGKDSPSWGRQQRVKTDPNGIAVLNIVEGGEGTHELKIRSGRDGGDRYYGKTSITSKRLAETTMENPLIVKVKTLRLSVKAMVKWDPSYSQEQFRHDKLSEEAEHTLEIKGAGSSHRKEIRPDGGLYYYDLKSGRYVISLSERGRKKYKITGGNVIVIPKSQKGPVENSITIMPAKQYDLRGIVVDKISKEPVANARVSGAGMPIKTGETGEFKVTVVEDMQASLLVQHGDYFPKVFAIPSKQPDAPIQIAIQPYPTLSGKMVVGKKNAPASFAKLRFRGYPRSFSAQCNEQGEYSVKLIPGKYRLSIKAQVMGKDIKQVRGSRPVVRAYDEPFKMGKSDEKRNFELAGIGTGVIKVSYSKKDLGDKEPLYVCLLRAKDKTIVSSVQITGEGAVTMYVGEGKYKILVAPSEDLGVIAGDIKIAEAQATKASVSVKKWRKMRITPTGSIELFGK